MPFLGYQFVVRATLHNVSLIHNDYFVAVTHRTQSVGYYYYRCATLAYALHHFALHNRVKRTCRLVKNENYRLTCKGCGYLHSLSLATGEITSSPYQFGVEASWT